MNESVVTSFEETEIESDQPEPESDDLIHPLFREVPESVSFSRLRKRLIRETRQTLETYDMIPRDARERHPPPRWLVCLSGGKDSYTLMAILLDLKWRGLLPVDLLACNLNQKQPGFPEHVLPEWLERYGIAYRIETQDTYSIVLDKTSPGATLCTMCSRLRRGILYNVARQEQCEAIVLGHHRDDILETFLLNLFHGGRLATMPPKLLNDEGDLFVLRPLALSAESEIARFAKAMQFPLIPCSLCGSQEGLQRQRIAEMLDMWELQNPGRRQIMFRALQNIRLSHMADPGVFDFSSLQRQANEKLSQEQPCSGKAVASLGT